MSLDVYLKKEGLRRSHNGSGIFVRENGQTKEISRAEWDAKFPGREPVTFNSTEESDEIYSRNITHNLSRMAAEAGIYTALWRPAELLDPAIAARIREQEKAGNYHDAGGAYELERQLPTPHARDIAPTLWAGLMLLKSDPERFKAFNPKNGWGDYNGFVSFVADYLAACEETPDAVVEVSR